MLRAIRKRVTWANVAMTLALVFAMAGGAYAAGSALTGKQKKEVIAIAKKYAGKPGKNGANGTNGTNGAPGTPGEKGANGTNGTNGKDGAPGAAGKSVTVSETASGCPEGGATVEVEGSKAPHEVCNGKEGSPWTAGGTLPVGAQETGTWTSSTNTGTEEANEHAAVSFTIPLAAALGSTQVHYVKVGEAAPSGCSGTVEAPEASSGNLCVFEGKLKFGGHGGVQISVPGKAITELGAVGAGVSGAILGITGLEPGAFVAGDWAVRG